MATTTNFGWTTPNDTDLVKDGASAIRTLGSSIDTSMAGLKGGTTGQVLSKTSNTDMAFTWVAQDDSNAIQNAIVDAKGDLIAATANDTPARLAVGNNGETLVADSSTSTGLRYQGNFAAGKNKIINGDFGIWQRGTSITPASGYGYTADRWRTYSWGSSTSTVSRQTFTAGSAPVAGYEGQYFLRVNSTNTNTFVGQPIEDVRTFAGQTVTISFWAKAASAISGTANIAFDQNFGSGGSTTVNVPISSGTSFTTSWVRYSYTGTLPSISGKTIGTGSYLDLTIALGVINNNFDIWGVQVEAGSVATAFQTATGTIQGELAACQRYYQKTNNQSETPGTAPTSTPINAINASTSLVVGVPPFKVSMRTAPTITLYSPVTGTSGKIRSGGADITASAADVGEYTIGYISATGLTAGSNSAISFTASAEL